MGALAGLGESPLEDVREDSPELGVLVDGAALGSPRGPDVRVEAPEVTHGRQVVAGGRVDDDVQAVDGADLALEQVTVGVADGLEPRVARDLVEPAVEDAAEHDRPLVLRDGDHTVADGLGAGDDARAHLLHPLHVAVAVRALAPVDAVRAADGVQLAGLVVTEDLVPADAVEATDCVGRGVDPAGLAFVLDREVEWVRVASGLELSDVDFAHMNLLVER